MVEMVERFHKPFKDHRYGLYYLSKLDTGFMENDDVLGPFSAPGEILRQIIDRDPEQDRLNVPVHPDVQACIENTICKGKEKPQPITVLEHALGTWHLAEQCLGFGKFKVLPRADAQPTADTTSLAARLTYGDEVWDTLLEEFSLAAFFQAYLPPEKVTCDIHGMKGVIEDYLNLSPAFEKYQDGETGTNSSGGSSRKTPIRPEFVAYWITSCQDDGESHAALKTELKHMVEEGLSIPEFDRIRRVRDYLFADTAPLNLRHLDLIGRIQCIYNECHGGVDNGLFCDTVHMMLSRFILAPRGPKDAHLLPNKYPWQKYCPYYVPEPNDDPPYRYLLPYVRGFELINSCVPEKIDSNSHSLWRSCAPAPTGGSDRVGLLRISFPGRAERVMNVSTRVFLEYLKRVTSPGDEAAGKA